MTTIEIEPVDYYCRFCDSAMETTGCVAPSCTGYRCMLCRAGCDLDEFDNGTCALALSHLSWAQAEEIREERRLRCKFNRPVRTVYLPERIAAWHQDAGRGECS